MRKWLSVTELSLENHSFAICIFQNFNISNPECVRLHPGNRYRYHGYRFILPLVILYVSFTFQSAPFYS